MIKKEALYREFARYYDKVYFLKKYQKEVEFIDRIIKKHISQKSSILDVACGTGSHAKLLVKKRYSVVGVDKNPHMLKLARKKVPQAKFKQGDMRNFNLNKKFDTVLCMFTSINYNLTMQDLVKTLKNFKRHLSDKGVIIFDFSLARPPINHGTFLGKDIVVLYANKDIKNIRKTSLYWIFNKGKYVEVVEDIHRIRFYSLKELSQATKKAGLKHKVYWDFSLNKKKGKRPVILCKK